MNKIEIGVTVKFINANSLFQGTITNIADGFCYVAVLGYSDTLKVPMENCLPVA